MPMGFEVYRDDKGGLVPIADKFWGWIAKLNPENVRGDPRTDRLNVHLIYLENDTKGRIRLIAEGFGNIDYNDSVRPLEEARADFTRISDALRVGKTSSYILDARAGERNIFFAREDQRWVILAP